jgi:NADH-quinone oxidoreductase subunit M
MASLLLLTVFLPLVGSAYLMMSPRLEARQARSIALGIVLATLALSLVILARFKADVTGYQFSSSVPWMGSLGVRFALGLDGVGLWLFVLTSLLLITAVFASWESVKDRPATHYALLLALETGLLGLFASLDVVLFYIFFEFTLIPLFFLIGIYGGPERRRASITFFLFTLAGSLLTLLGVIALVAVHYQYRGTLTFSIPELTAGLTTLPWPGWYNTSSWFSPQVLIFLLLFAGFAVKVPMFPFHTWLPLAHVEAPTAGSILLAGVMLKVGGYGLFRFNLGMTPLGAEALFPLMAALSVVSILYGAFAALAQTDVKRLVAYSSVSHMGFVTLGLFSLNGTGIDGSMIQMLNHGITTGALFALVGVIYERYHTREMSELGGLWNWSPLWAFFLILASLGSAAVPFLNGFVGEFPILLGMYRRSPLAASLAALGMILGAYYLLWMIQRIAFGPLREPGGHGAEHGHAPAPAALSGLTIIPPLAGGSHDAHVAVSTMRPMAWHEIAGLTPLMVLIVLIGVLPGPFFDRLRPATVPVIDKIALEVKTAANPPPLDHGVTNTSPPPQPPSQEIGAPRTAGAGRMGGPSGRVPSAPPGGAGQPKSKGAAKGAPAAKKDEQPAAKKDEPAAKGADSPTNKPASTKDQPK